MRARAALASGAVVLASAGLLSVPVGVAQAVTASCSGIFDANGDGIEDMVVGSPKEDYPSSSKQDAGVVRVLYGSATGHTFTGGVKVITEESAGGGTSEPGDHFGAAVAVGDLNGDTCKDLVIGVPGEDSSAGRIVAIYAVPSGSGSVLDLATSQSISQNSGSVPSTSEPNDEFGAALAFQGGTPGATWLWVGSPGEDIYAVKAAGMVFRFTAGTGGTGTKMSVTTGVSSSYEGKGAPGTYEAQDRLGEVMSGSAKSVLFGVPKEDIGMINDAGQVLVFTDHWSSFSQETTTPDVPSTSEPGDRFGSAVAQIPSCHDYGAEAYVVGSPGENVGAVVDSGYVTVVDVAAGTAMHLQQGDAALVGGTLEADDQFGFTIAASGHLIAIGIPFEDTSTTRSGENTGMVYQGLMGCDDTTPTVTAHSTISLNDTAGLSVPKRGDRFGSSLGFNRLSPSDPVADLVVGAPFKADGSVQDAGRIIVFRAKGSDGLFAGVPATNLAQSSPSINGNQQKGDQFGGVLSNNAG